MVFENWLSRMLKTAPARRRLQKLDRPSPVECCEQRILLSGTGVFIDGGDALGDETSEFDRVALGDLDGNGTIDAITVDSLAPSRVWLNDGSGAFVDTGQRLGSSGSKALDIELADLDGDGDLDAFMARRSGTVNGVRTNANMIWLNDGAGNFTDSGQRLGSSDSKAVSLADLDGDSDIDAFVAMEMVIWMRFWLRTAVQTGCC